MIHINHLNEVLEAIEGRSEFKVKVDSENQITIVNYMVELDDTFPDPNEEGISRAEKRRRMILRECRGITFCSETGAVISRKFHKFFNVGQKEETRAHRVDFSKPHVIMEKLDGSMITPLWRNNKIIWCSKMGETFLTPIVNQFVQKRPEYEQIAQTFIDNNITPMFEFCSRQQRIVIDYPEDRLVLLAARYNDSGEYLPYSELCQVAHHHGVDVVRALPGSVGNILTFLEETRGLSGQEGWVIAFDDGTRLKVKAEEYIIAHRAKDSLAHEKNVLYLVASDTIDDVLPVLPEADQERVRRYATDVSQAMISVAEEVRLTVEAYADTDQRTFALEVAPRFSGQIQSLLFKVRAGKASAFDAVRDTVKNKCGSQAAVDSVRDLIGGVQWTYSAVED